MFLNRRLQRGLSYFLMAGALSSLSALGFGRELKPPGKAAALQPAQNPAASLKSSLPAKPPLKMSAQAPGALDPLSYYEQKGDVVMRFKKTTYIPLLEKQIISTGRIFLSKGRVRLNVDDPLHTSFIFIKQVLWYITCPDRVQAPGVMKWDLLKQAGAGRMILALFNKDLFGKMFRFVSWKMKGRARVFSFAPVDLKSDVQALSLKTSDHLLLKADLKWKNLNLEEYAFFDIRLKQSLRADLFQTDRKKLTCSKEMDIRNQPKRSALNKPKARF